MFYWINRKVVNIVILLDDDFLLFCMFGEIVYKSFILKLHNLFYVSVFKVSLKCFGLCREMYFYYVYCELGFYL